MFRTIVKIAWASLRRRTTRSLMVVTMICLSLWGLFLMEGIYDGMTEQMIANAIRSDSGHVSLFGQGYRLDASLDNRIKGSDTAKLEKFLDSDPRISSWVKRLKQQGLVATAHYSRNTVISGVNLRREKGHGRLEDYLVQGEYGFGRQAKGAIIGFKLAEKLKVSIGGKIILTAQDLHSEVTATALRVTGIIKTNNLRLDETTVFMDIAAARKFLGVEHGVTQVAVMLRDNQQTAGFQAGLRQAFSRLEVLRWDEMYPALLQSRVIMNGFSLVVSLMIFGIAGIGILGVMLVSVLERVREFGIMLAIGTGFGRLRAIIMTESLLMGVTGFLAGAFCGWLSLLYFKIYGLDLTVFSAAFNEFGMDAVTHAIIRPDYFVNAFVSIIFAVLVSMFFSLRILRKSKPIEVINEI